MRNADRAKGGPEAPPRRAPEPEADAFAELAPNGEGRLHAIIKRQSIMTYFHPIVSVLAGAVVGFEAFSRGRLDGEVLYPDELFELAEQEDLLRPLDILCRQKAVGNFRPLHRANQNIFLALNVNSEGVRRGETELDDLVPLCRAAGLGPGNVAVEIDESAIAETDYLYRFVTGLRDQGFLVVFDNVGRRHIHFGAISTLKPDVIKVDRLLVRGVDESFAKRQTLRAVVNIAGKAGAAVVAMGVEREEEALVCLEHGVHLMQGYYFSRSTEEKNVIKQCYSLAESLGRNFEAYSRRKIVRSKSLHAEVGRRIEELVKQLSHAAAEGFDQALRDFLAERPEMNSVYILDESGQQITEGMHNSPDLPPRKRLVAKPHYRGESHAFKDYYHYLMSGYDRFATESFASAVSGRLCKTLCRAFRDASGARYIFCADLILEDD